MYRSRSDGLATTGGVIEPALLDSVRDGEAADDVTTRLGKPARETVWVGNRSVRQPGAASGTTTHAIEPMVETRFVRLNVTRPAYIGGQTARIYELEVYGPEGARNFALRQPVTGSQPCREDRGPEKAVNGSVTGGEADSWCSDRSPRFLEVDSWRRARGESHRCEAATQAVKRDFDTRDFNIQL